LVTSKACNTDGCKTPIFPIILFLHKIAAHLPGK
jgi:hypothetical protein